MSNISSNFFLSDLSKAFRNGFHSLSSTASAILNDGIVYLSNMKAPLTPVLYRHPNPLLMMNAMIGTINTTASIQGEKWAMETG